MKKTTRKNTVRAGRRNCRRCAKQWMRERGDKGTICHDCRKRCSRCNCILTDKNVYVKQTRTNHQCKKCHGEQLKRTKNKDRTRDYYLVNKYGITLDEYENLLNLQGGVCWICQRPPKEDVADGRRSLHVDHSHVKNDKKYYGINTRERIRGLLCWRCNASLQKFKDNPDLMRRAADYVEQCPAQEFLKKETE